MASEANTANGLVLSLPNEWLKEAAKIAAEGAAEIVLAKLAEQHPYLTTDEAADYLKTSKQRIYDLARNGRLKPVKDGRRNLYRQSEIDAYLESGRERG